MKRRRFAQSVVVGSATSGMWLKPVIQTAVLPVHAQTSIIAENQEKTESTIDPSLKVLFDVVIPELLVP
ncbi:MAG: hypothetical protein V3V09_03665 [Arenicellales bacterium]